MPWKGSYLLVLVTQYISLSESLLLHSYSGTFECNVVNLLFPLRSDLPSMSIVMLWKLADETELLSLRALAAVFWFVLHLCKLVLTVSGLSVGQFFGRIVSTPTLQLNIFLPI